MILITALIYKTITIAATTTAIAIATATGGNNNSKNKRNAESVFIHIVIYKRRRTVEMFRVLTRALGAD